MKNKVNISINLDEISNNLDESIKFLKENKVRYTEIRTIHCKNVVNFELSEIKKIANKLFSNGLKISAIASPLFKWYLKPNNNKTQHDNFSFNPSITKKQKMDYILKTIKIAKIFDTKNVRVFSNLKQKGVNNEDFFKDELFIFMLQKFSESGINPLLENEPVCLISDVNDYLETLQKFKSEGLKAWCDIANFYDTGNFIDTTLINKLKPYIKYLHVKDKASAKEKQYVPLGKGYINYKRIFTDLIPALNNSIFASIETHVSENKISATKVSLDYLRNILSKERITYALVGAGRISRNYTNAFKNNINSEIRGVFDIDIKKARLFSEQNDIEIYESFDQLVSDPKVKVVNICTPHDTHITLAKIAAAKGKTVLSEKPFAISSKDLKKYLKNEKYAKNTYVVFQNIFNKPVQTLLENYNKGKLGNIQFFAANIRWCRDDSYFSDWHGKISKSGGSLYNQAIHTIQLILLLVDKEITNVTYRKRVTRKITEVEDLGMATIELENGGFGYIELCLINRGGDLESSLYLVGKKGAIKIDGRSLCNMAYKYTKSNEDGILRDCGNQSDIYGSGHTTLIKTLSNKLLGIKDSNVKYLVRANDVLSTITLIEKLYGKSR